MRKFGQILLVAVVFAAAGNARATVVDFDDLKESSFVPNGYGGINWGGVWAYYGTQQPPFNPESGPNRVFVPATVPGEYGFSFVTPGEIFDGAWFAGDSSSVLHFNLYRDGVQVSTSANLIPDANPAFLASGYGGLVDAVGVFSSSNLYVMDDVTYEPANAEVPEPASLALLGTGLLATGLVGTFRSKLRKSGVRFFIRSRADSQLHEEQPVGPIGRPERRTAIRRRASTSSSS